VIFVSGTLERNRLAFALQQGATDVVEKPIDLKLLTLKTWRILAHWGFSPPKGFVP
jgi:hypothetical protein